MSVDGCDASLLVPNHHLRMLTQSVLSLARWIPRGVPLLLQLAVVFPACTPGEAAAQSTVVVSSDISVDLGGTVYHDEHVVADDQLGTITQESLGALPGVSDVTGYELLADGDRLFSLDTTADLGTVTLTPADVGRYDGVVYSIEFDGDAEGVSDGSSVDAITVDTSGNLLLSFDTTVDLGSIICADEDVVSFNGSSFSLVFDGSAEGLAEELDLDGASIDPDGNLALSLDGSGSVGGVNFDDEDVLEFQTGGSWSLLYDGSALHPSLESVDVNAVRVPEPAALSQLLVGTALLMLLGRRRKRHHVLDLDEAG
jgi:hypothetical protein